MAGVETYNLSVKYSGASTPALNDVTLSIQSGEFVLVSGPSGCGKSTLGLALAGFIPNRVPSKMKGEIFVDGQPINGLDAHEVAKRVGMVFQNPDSQLVQLDVESEIVFGPENLGLRRTEIKRRLEQVIAMTNIDGVLHQAIEELSGGQRQRVSIAATLVMESKVLVLDEPTSDLDPVGTQEVLRSLKKLNEDFHITIILIEHKIEEVIGFVDRVILMNEGRVVLDKKPTDAFSELVLWDNLGVTVPDLVRLAHQYPVMFNGAIPLTATQACEHLNHPHFIDSLRRAQTQIPWPITNRIRQRTANGASPIPALNYMKVGLRYGVKTVLQDVAFQVGVGEWVALVGANGSGKTSLAAVAMGFIQTTQGRVECFGRPVTTGRISDQAPRMSYLFQAADKMLFCATVEKELTFGVRGAKRREASSKVSDVSHLMDLSDYLNHQPYQLSYGQRKRLALGSLLMKEPDLIILDEPTTGQDEQHAREFLTYLERLRKERQTGFLMITHDMRMAAKYADRVVLLADGRVLENGPPETVFVKRGSMDVAKISPPSIADLHLRLLGDDAQWVATNIEDFVACLNWEAARV